MSQPFEQGGSEQKSRTRVNRSFQFLLFQYLYIYERISTIMREFFRELLGELLKPKTLSFEESPFFFTTLYLFFLSNFLVYIRLEAKELEKGRRAFDF